MKSKTQSPTSNSMEFKFKSNIFKNTAEDHQRIYKDKYDPNKNYPHMTGTLSIPKSQLPMLVEYLHYALRSDALETDDYLNEVVVPVKISGYQQESKKGKKYLALSYEPNYKVMMAAKEAKESNQQPASDSVDQAAANLAEKTAGEVVSESDPFF